MANYEDALTSTSVADELELNAVAIKGLNEFSRKLDELQKATAALDGDITSVNFDPHDPQSIELAIQRMEAAIDERVGNYRGNDLVQNLVVEIKERYRQQILERAESARAEKDDS